MIMAGERYHQLLGPDNRICIHVMMPDSRGIFANHCNQKASIFWHSADGKIMNGFYNCDPESGTFIQSGEFTISDTAKVTDIHPNTGLSVELLGSTAGYRVYYHDKDSQVHQLSYTTKTDWNYYGAVSQDPTFSQALASLHSGTNNITVISPKNDKDVEVSRYNTDGTWHICMSCLVFLVAVVSLFPCFPCFTNKAFVLAPTLTPPCSRVPRGN